MGVRNSRGSKNRDVLVGNRAENPVVYFDIQIGDAKAGRMTIELRADLCPMTCENFRVLVTGERGHVKEGDDLIPLHYKGSKIHRVVRDSPFARVFFRRRAAAAPPPRARRVRDAAGV